MRGDRNHPLIETAQFKKINTRDKYILNVDTTDSLALVLGSRI